MVFRNGNTLAPDSIWSVSEGEFTKLVDLNTAVPGGTGNFSALILDFSAPGYPVLSNGTVVFAGRDSAGTGYTGGLYSVPSAGGAVTRVVNRNVVAPGGSNFDGGLQYFSVDSGKVAFFGVSEGGAQTGIYTANTNGTSVTAVADVDHPAHPEFVFPVSNFNFPSIDGTTVAFYGNTVFDPSTGYNALYTTSSSGGFSYGEPATSEEALPGDPTNPFHTRFRSPRLDGSTIYFAADDSNSSSPNFKGIFSVAKGGGAFTNLVDTNDTLPGLVLVNSNSFDFYSARDGMVAFNAVDGMDHYGVYSHSDSLTTKVVATGDSGPFADLDAVCYAPVIGDEAVSGGAIVLQAGVRFSATGIYLATPYAESADLSATPSFSPSNTTVGNDTTLSLDLTNDGPATAQTIALVVTLPPGLTFKSAAGGTYDDATRTVTFSLASLASGALHSYSIVATVDATGGLTASALVTSATADSDLMNNHAFATTDAVFASTGNWVVRKIVDNFTPVPDRTGETFVIGGGVDPLPAIDGGKVAFVEFSGSGSPASVWSVNSDGSGDFTRLVDTATNVPSGAGEKFGYMKNLRLRNESVAFLAFDADQMHDGIYSIPVEGGAAKAIATSGMTRPGNSSSIFGYQDFIQSLSFGYMADGNISFVAQSGLYVYPIAGGAGHPVVYPGSNIPTADFGGATLAFDPSISGNRVVWEGTGGRDALLGSYLDQRQFFAVADILTESPSTPGENFVLSPNGSFSFAQTEGETVVFRAFSGTNASIRGIYSRKGRDPVVKLVDTNTNVPGGTGKFIAFSAAGSLDLFSLSNGEVVFLGVDEDNVVGFYSVPVTGGAITKIVKVGDMVGNATITGFSQPPFQANSVGQHQVAFRADFSDSVTGHSGPALFVASRADTRLANIATRLPVGTSDNVLIAGLIVSGNEEKTILLRGIGPSRADVGVPNVLADPTLELHDSTGAIIASNDNWQDTQKQEIEDTGIPPTKNLESAIVATVDPGSYTAILRGKSNGTGNGLVEVYDLAASSDLGTRLINISTRGVVQTGDNVMIGGIIVQGLLEKHLIVRAIGPSLADVGVPNVLPDPTLDVVNLDGDVIASNDNWRDSQEDEIIASTIPPDDDLESAVDLYVMPGSYTAIVRGKGTDTGNALVEFYELP